MMGGQQATIGVHHNALKGKDCRVWNTYLAGIFALEQTRSNRPEQSSGCVIRNEDFDLKNTGGRICTNLATTASYSFRYYR